MPSIRDGRQVGGLVLRALLTTVFLVAGGMKLAAAEFEVSNFARFGYPPWFMYAVGAAQLLGAVLLWGRGFVAYGALLLAALMVGGVVSHLWAGDPILMPAPATFLFVLLCGLAYARRREFLPSDGRGGT